MSDHFVNIDEREEIGADMKQVVALDHLSCWQACLSSLSLK
jgi:hypothetical protein